MSDARRESFLAGSQWYYRLLYRFAWCIVVPIVRWYTRMRIVGAEHIPDTGAFILAPVHRSYVDTPIVGSVTKRRLRFMGKASMWKFRWPGKLFSALGAFPIHRGAIDREALRRALAVLDAGDGLVLFPEGERKQGAVVQPLLDGVIYIAIKSGAPIIPVGVGGSEWVMPKGARRVYRRQVHVEIGPPVSVPEVVGSRVPRADYRATADRLSAELQRLFDDAMARVPYAYDEGGEADVA